MDKLNCYVVKDLMPLYVDDVLSEETARDVRSHLQDCGSCREEYESLSKELVLPSSPEVQMENSRVLNEFKRKWNLKKIVISAVSVGVTLALTFFLFALGREFLFDASRGVLAPTIIRAYSRNMEAEDGWTRLTFEKDDRWFRKATQENMEYLEFDGMFYEKEIVNSGNSSAAVEMRILDSDGNVVVEPFSIEAGRAVAQPQLERDTPYIVEIRAEGKFFEITFS